MRHHLLLTVILSLLLVAPVGAQPSDIAPIPVTDRLDSLSNKIVALEIDRIKHLVVFSIEHPSVIGLDRELDLQYRQLAELQSSARTTYTPTLLAQAIETKIAELELDRISLSVTYQEAHPQVVANKMLSEALYSRLEELPSSSTTQIKQSTAKLLEDKIVELEVDRIKLSVSYQEAHPQVFGNKMLLEALYKSLNELRSSDVYNLTIKQAMIQKIEFMVTELQEQCQVIATQYGPAYAYRQGCEQVKIALNAKLIELNN